MKTQSRSASEAGSVFCIFFGIPNHEDICRLQIGKVRDSAKLVVPGPAGLTDDDKTRLHQGLVQAINTVKIAVRDAQKPVADPNLPNLSFKGAEVTLNFILDQEGHITFLGFEKALELAASVAAEYTNTIKLTLESA